MKALKNMRIMLNSAVKSFNHVLSANPQFQYAGNIRQVQQPQEAAYSLLVISGKRLPRIENYSVRIGLMDMVNRLPYVYLPYI